MPSARATTTCPLGRACAASTCWPEKTTLAPPPGLFRSNRTRSPAAVTAKPTPLSPAKVGGWTTALPRLNSDLRLSVIEEATADPGQQGHGAAAAIDDREIRDEVAVQIAHDHRDGAVAAGLQTRPGDADPIAVGVVGAENHGDVVAALVGDQHVRNAVAVDVGHGETGRGGADEVGTRRGSEGRHAVADGRGAIDHHGVAAGADDHGVGQGRPSVENSPLDVARRHLLRRGSGAERLHRGVLVSARPTEPGR